MSERAIAIDFDKVLHSYTSGWNGEVPTDPPIAGAKGFVFWLLSRGYQPFVFTTRALTGRGRIEVEHWLRRNGFPDMLVTAQKLPALLYLDDRSWRFNGAFFEVFKFLSSCPEADCWVDDLESACPL